jgi:hypothetical protein
MGFRLTDRNATLALGGMAIDVSTPLTCSAFT